MTDREYYTENTSRDITVSAIRMSPFSILLELRMMEVVVSGDN